jgi:DNA repair protein RadC
MLVDTVQAAVDLLEPLVGRAERETLAILHLDSERRLIAITIEDPGTEREVELPVRTILQRALRLGSTALVVGHNHPSGNPDPSPADEAATKALAHAAGAVGIRLHDHLIFGTGECRSFRALGLI